MRFASSLCPESPVARQRSLPPLAVFALMILPLACAASAKHEATPKTPAAAAAPPDVVIFINGDQLSGTMIRSEGPAVLFHSKMVGAVQIPWAAIKELRTNGQMVVIQNNVLKHRGKQSLKLPSGPITVADQRVTVHAEGGASVTPVPLKDVKFIIDEKTFQKQIAGHPGIFEGWNGALTAGTTLVQATQNQTSLTAGVDLTRLVPTVSWLAPRNRTRISFTGAFGKITQPSFTAGGVTVPAASVETNIYRAAAERDESLTPRFYLLAKTVFDHNYSQDLDLRQRYGGGIGWIALKTPKQGLYLDAMLQYEGQSFLNAAASANQKLVGSTLDATWGATLSHGITATQIVYWIPAFNNSHAYSVGESNTLTLPFFKGLAFSIQSIDDYLNNPPPAIPPTKRNSFEFTTGISLTIKSKY